MTKIKSSKTIFKFSWSLVLSLSIVFLLSACGRYIPPVSPVVLVPTPVQELTAVVDPSGSKKVTITWVAPEKDMRGKPLTELTGYSVEALSIATDGSQVLTDKSTEDTFEEVAFVPDTYLAALKAKQDDAEQRGDIVRRVKVTKEQRTFSFTESAPTTGTVIYRVLAVNAEGGPSANDKIVQVSDAADGSRVATILDQLVAPK
jgi:hypothetical protein